MSHLIEYSQRYSLSFLRGRSGKGQSDSSEFPQISKIQGELFEVGSGRICLNVLCDSRGDGRSKQRKRVSHRSKSVWAVGEGNRKRLTLPAGKNIISFDQVP
jgi:hypothetical protein